jgi:hypothetical protein
MDSLGHKALGLDVEAKRYCEVKMIMYCFKVASTRDNVRDNKTGGKKGLVLSALLIY